MLIDPTTALHDLLPLPRVLHSKSTVYLVRDTPLSDNECKL